MYTGGPNTICLSCVQARARLEAELSAAAQREAERRAAEGRLQEETTMLRRTLGGLPQLSLTCSRDSRRPRAHNRIYLHQLLPSFLHLVARPELFGCDFAWALCLIACTLTCMQRSR